MPATWKTYGVDANDDGVKDPYNPVDAIFAAARYLRAAGADQDLRRGIFAYNHADWYVDSVLMRARIDRRPAGRLRRLAAPASPRAASPSTRTPRYAGRLTEGRPQAQPRENAAYWSRARDRTGIDIFASAGAPVIAVNDGRVVGLGHNARLGRYVRSRTSTATSSPTGTSPRSPGPTRRRTRSARWPRSDPPRARAPQGDRKPTRAASATSKRGAGTKRARAGLRRPAKQRRRQGRTPRGAAPRGARRRPCRTSKAPVRPPGPPAGARRRRRAPARPPATPPAAPAPRSSSTRATSRPKRAAQGRPRDRAARCSAASAAPAEGRPARAVRDPPGRPRRPAHRPEADPRRLEAARVHRDLPRRAAQPVLRRRRQDAVASARSC